MLVAALVASMEVLQLVPDDARQVVREQLVEPVALAAGFAVALVPMLVDLAEPVQGVPVVLGVLAKAVQRPEVAIVAVVLPVALAAGFVRQVPHIAPVPGVVLHPKVLQKLVPSCYPLLRLHSCNQKSRYSLRIHPSQRVP